MIKIAECPRCANNGLKIEVKDGYKIVATGKSLKDYPFKVICSVCKRVIKYDIEKE